MNCPECNTKNHENSKFCSSCGLDLVSKEKESQKPNNPTYSGMLKSRFVLWASGALGFIIGSSISDGSIWYGLAFGIVGFGCGYYILSRLKRR